jgi:hypothetical protein
MSELGFTIEKRGSVDVLVWDDGGCRPASGTENLLFSENADLKAKLAEAEKDSAQAHALLKEGANHLKESMAREEKNYAWIKEAKAQNAALGRENQELKKALVVFADFHNPTMPTEYFVERHGTNLSDSMSLWRVAHKALNQSPPSDQSSSRANMYRNPEKLYTSETIGKETIHADQSSKMTGVGGLCGINHEWISDSDGAHCLVCGAAYAPPAKERDACMEQEYAREEYLNDDGRTD